MIRVRFAPSPTGYLHIGSARTFIFNWLYARRNGGTMILRIDDTDLERNTEASLNSIFEGLNWLGLTWDEQYRQSERLALHKQTSRSHPREGPGLSRFHARPTRRVRKRRCAAATEPGSSIPASAKSRGRKATAAPLPAKNLSCASAFRATPAEDVTFTDAVYGEQSKSTADIEDFALLRSDGTPDLSSRLLRRRYRSPHHPRRARPGPSRRTPSNTF